MKSMYRAVMIIAALVLLLPLSVRAEIRAGSFEVNPYVGVNFFQHNQNLKTAPVFGGRVGYNFTKYFGIEIGGQFLRTHLNDSAKMDNTEGQFGYPMDRVDLYFYHIDAVVHLIPDGRINPFIVAGFGGANYSPSISNGGGMPAFNVGVGVKVWLMDNIALRFDVQDYIVTEIFQETYHNIGVTAGVVFAFGGRRAAAPAAPAPAPEPAAEAIEKGRTTLDVKFDFDKSVIKKGYYGDIDNLVSVMKQYPELAVALEGHTDWIGSDAYNQTLSQERADVVKQYMVEKGGIDPNRLKAIGYGESRPIADNKTDAGRAQNRRTEAVAEYLIKK
ncbi:MAG: OmpA family protein [Smithellaceae bacterium]